MNRLRTTEFITNAIKLSVVITALTLTTSCSTMKKNDQTLKGSEKDPKIPAVTMPVVRKMWVPDKIEGNKFETGHYVYILEKTSNWSQSNDK